MSTADELKKLHDLQQAGALSQAEFDAAKAQLLPPQPGPGAGLEINRLRLSNDDKWLAGVCGGIAAVTGVESWLWRLLFVLGLAFGGVTLIFYLALWIFVPRSGS